MAGSQELKQMITRSIIFLLVGVLFCLGEVRPAIAGNSLYGFTSEGLFYIHVDVVAAAGGDSPELVAGFNNWARVPMSRSGNYYIYQASTTGQFKFPLLYCFDLGGERYIPHVLVDMGSPLINPDEVKSNNSGGYNFLTKPQPDPRR